MSGPPREDSPANSDVRPKSSDDVQLLQSMGYAQELLRRMGGFSNFAISFSIICILAGGITSFQLGVSSVGGAAAGVVWPMGVGFCFIVALCMAHIASAFPTAGGLYHWSSILGGRGWGWARPGSRKGLCFLTCPESPAWPTGWAAARLLAFIGPSFSQPEELVLIGNGQAQG